MEMTDTRDGMRADMAGFGIEPSSATDSAAEADATPRVRKRILAFAYACDPGQGSEPGVGWAWSRMLARLGETWVITRRDYQASIEEALPSIPERENLTFVYVDLPDEARGWQRGVRGPAPSGLRVYYLLW